MENIILIYLAKKNNTNLLQRVLRDNTVNLNVQDLNGNTPLIWASRNNNFLMCKELINAGADWNIFNNDGKCFIDYLNSYRKNIIELYPKKYETFLQELKNNKYNL